MNSCKTCAWCIERVIPSTVEGHDVTVRHCHRYAPRATEDRWPKVEFSEWCGEYVERCGYDRAI